MMKKTAQCNFCFPYLILLLFFLSGCTAIQPVTLDRSLPEDQQLFPHVHLDRVLSTYVDTDGRVDYQSLQASSGDLDIYYALVASYSPDSNPELFPDVNHELAYWINAYNAAVLKTVITYYPIQSVTDIKTPTAFSFLSDKAGFFFFQRLRFGGVETSLYYLENSVIRKRYDEPRIHFALNCASKGCPRLPQKAFTGELLNQQLDDEARSFVAEERNFRMDHYDKIIYLSEIFDWFEEDFTGWYARKFPGDRSTLLDYIQLYVSKEQAFVLNRVKHAYEVRFVPYDWGLNDQNRVEVVEDKSSSKE